MPKRKAREDPLDEVYLGDFDGFVGRRNELAKRLRAEGDSEGAERVRALKKPSRPAWAINQLGAEPRDELLDAGAALRKAQERVIGGKSKGADLREVSDRERAVVDRALEAVGAIAEEGGAALNPAAMERARQTLHAVALDDDVREQFARRRLATEHEAAALGGLAAPTVEKRTAKTEDRQAAKRRKDELKAAEAEVRALEKRLRAAEREVEDARRGVEEAQRYLARASEELQRIQSEAAAAGERSDALREAAG